MQTPPRFEIQERSQIKLKPPEFLCDRVIHRQIEPPLPDTSFFLNIIGGPGQGKTSMLVNLLSSRQAYKRAFNHVHVVMPPSSCASLSKNIFRDHDKMHDELTYETLETVHEACLQASADKENSLLVLDDVTASLKDSDIQTLLKRLLYNRRHLRISVIILTQSFNATPLAIRKAVSHFIVFKAANKREFEAIFSELIQTPRDIAEALQRFVFRKKHDFLYGDVATGSFFRNFDRIRITNAEEDLQDQDQAQDQ